MFFDLGSLKKQEANDLGTLSKRPIEDIGILSKEFAKDLGVMFKTKSYIYMLITEDNYKLITEDSSYNLII